MRNQVGKHKRTKRFGLGDTLSRERVLEEALALLDREGLEHFSMRRLAKLLGVTPMALYNHVGGKQDLLQGVADRVIEQVKYPAERKDWCEGIRDCFRALRNACIAHPSAVPLVESAKVLPASAFRAMEITLSALQSAGLGPNDSLRAYSLLMTFTLGQVSYKIKGWSRGVDPAAALKEGRIAPSTFPAVVQAASIGNWDFDASFEFGLSVILAGLKELLVKRGKRAKNRAQRLR
jgi:TetR/AcrR family transcriptional regulator, tetracycline repressor protein